LSPKNAIYLYTKNKKPKIMLTIIIIALLVGVAYFVFKNQKPDVKAVVNSTDDLAPESTPAPSVVTELAAVNVEKAKKAATKKPVAKTSAKTKSKK
jgi:preprotein translocase subunit YajC